MQLKEEGPSRPSLNVGGMLGILLIYERNLAFMWVCGKSRIQLAGVAH